MENGFYDCFITLKRWLENRNSGKTWVKYFEGYGYKKIAIYGAGDVGRLLYDELKDSDIEIAYFIDRNAEGLNEISGIQVITPEEIVNQPKVDSIIISPIGDYVSICEALTRIAPNMPTVSLKDAVYEI